MTVVIFLGLSALCFFCSAIGIQARVNFDGLGKCLFVIAALLWKVGV